MIYDSNIDLTRNLGLLGLSRQVLNLHKIQIQDKLQSFFKINIWEIKRNKGIYAYIQVV